MEEVHRVLSSRGSAEPASWRTARAPYLGAIMKALTGAGANLLRDTQGRPVEAFEPGMILYRPGGG